MQASVISYALASSACEKSEVLDKALQFFVQMQQSEMQASVISYALVAVLAKKMKERENDFAVLYSGATGCDLLHLCHYTSAISACERKEEWEQALQLFAHMQQSEVQLDINSYNLPSMIAG